MFEVTFLPATFGDAIWVRYGHPGALHAFLIDGGTLGTRRHITTQLERLPVNDRHVELVVVTHIDQDHLGGILSALERDAFPATIGDLWFNGWAHLPLPDDEILGAVQAERLTDEILRRGLSWNAAFGPNAEHPIVIPDQGPLPTIQLLGGMKLTLLSPTYRALARLRPVWKREALAAGLSKDTQPAAVDALAAQEDETLGALQLPDIEALANTAFLDDDSEANASSIALLAEFDNKRALFAADTPAGQLQSALERVSPHEPLRLDLFKVSHHGSRRTTSRELLQRVACRRYAFSTNGAVFRHPHAESIARILKFGGDRPELLFNYRSPVNEIWEVIAPEHGATTSYPSNHEGLVVNL